MLPISRPFKVNERSVAVVGDMTHCPQCRGDFPIAEGDATRTWHDKPMAFHGHKTACGAVLMSGNAPATQLGTQELSRTPFVNDEKLNPNQHKGPKEIIEVYWSYGNSAERLQEKSRHVSDMNLHVKTANYAVGETLTVYIEPDSSTLLFNQDGNLELTGSVNAQGEVVFTNVFKDKTINLANWGE